MLGGRTVKNIDLMRICILLFVFFFILPKHSFAQRGEPYQGGATPWESPTQGFPGYFDTNMVAEGGFVTEFPPVIIILPTPFLAFDYGVTDTLTVGTNAIFSTLPWILGGVGASVKVRSLMYGTESNQSAATYYGGYLASYKGSPIKAYYQLMTWNHAYRPISRHTIYGHAHYTRINVEIGQESSLDRMSASQTSLMIGGGYSFDINSAWTIRGNALIPTIQSLDLDTSSMTATQSQLIGQSGSVLGVVQTEFKSSEQALWGIGLTNVTLNDSRATIPWITLAIKW
jgi:hypothetical protein